MSKKNRVTPKRCKEFIDTLKGMGEHAGNKNLRSKLAWPEELYWNVQGRLIEQGLLVSGRGKGGSVHLSGTHPEHSENTKERELYDPLTVSVENWIKSLGLDNVLVAATHSRGSKETGGTFTRPDITAVGIREYVYLPKRLEVITFEVKKPDALNVLGILEAVAHREAANRAYVIYVTSKAKFEAAKENERIMELSQKYGIGVILADNISSAEDLEVLTDAIRHEPDPARLDQFLYNLPDENMKNQLSKWKVG